MRQKYPPIGATPVERIAWYKTNPIPHVVEEPYSCPCSACAMWRDAQFWPAVPGTIVIGIEYDHRKGGSGDGSNSWCLGEEYAWGFPIRKPSILVSDMPADCSGHHLSPVLVMTPDMGLRVTPRMWLLILD